MWRTRAQNKYLLLLNHYITSWIRVAFSFVSFCTSCRITYSFIRPVLTMIWTTIIIIITTIRCTNGQNTSSIPNLNAAEANKYENLEDPPTASDGSSRQILQTYVDIESLDSIDEKKMDFRIDYYLRQTWSVSKDWCSYYYTVLDLLDTFDDDEVDVTQSTLNRTRDDVVIMPYDVYRSYFWSPDTSISSSKSEDEPSSDRILKLSVLIIRGNRQLNSCKLQFLKKLFSMVSCKINLKEYPLDVQICTIPFQSFAFDGKELKFIWGQEEDPIKLNPGISLTQHQLTGIKGIEGNRRILNESFSVVSIKIKFRRIIISTLMAEYIPSALIVSISWLSLWIYETSAGINLLVTALLALLTQFTTTRGRLPSVSYVNVSCTFCICLSITMIDIYIHQNLDIWFVACFFFVFASIIQFTIVKFILNQSEEKIRKDEVIQKNSSWHHAVSQAEGSTLVNNPILTIQSNIPEEPDVMVHKASNIHSSAKDDRKQNPRGTHQSIHSSISIIPSITGLSFYPPNRHHVSYDTRHDPTYRPSKGHHTSRYDSYYRHDIINPKTHPHNTKRKPSHNPLVSGDSRHHHHISSDGNDQPIAQMTQGHRKERAEVTMKNNVTDGTKGGSVSTSRKVRKSPEERAERFALISRVIFPLAFLLFNSIYWWTFIQGIDD